MSYFTYCHARGCTLFQTCKRAEPPAPDDTVEYFSDEPFRVVGNKLECDMYFGTNQISIFEQLEEIANGRSENDNKGADGGEKED